MSDKYPCEMISWHKVVGLIQKLAEKIRQDAFQPDIIVAIARGGFVPARLLADYLARMNLTSIKIEHYIDAFHQQPVTTVIYPLTINVSEQRVLVVDDVSDSGETFEAALQHICQRSSPSAIKTAALHHKAVSSYTPDYYAAKVVKWRWLAYPWAQVEDISAFITEMQPCPDSLTEIATQLKTSYGIQVSDKLLKYIINGL